MTIGATAASGPDVAGAIRPISIFLHCGGDASFPSLVATIGQTTANCVERAVPVRSVGRRELFVTRRGDRGTFDRLTPSLESRREAGTGGDARRAASPKDTQRRAGSCLSCTTVVRIAR